MQTRAKGSMRGPCQVQTRSSDRCRRSPSSKLLAIAHKNGVVTNASGPVEIWDAETGKPVATVAASGGVRGLAWSHDGTTLAVSEQLEERPSKLEFFRPRWRQACACHRRTTRRRPLLYKGRQNNPLGHQRVECGRRQGSPAVAIGTPSAADTDGGKDIRMGGILLVGERPTFRDEARRPRLERLRRRDWQAGLLRALERRRRRFL